MADNFNATAGDGTIIGAADDIGGVLYPRVKISQGADGAATDVSSAAPLQVTGANGTFPVSGTLTAVTTVGTITNVVHVDDNSSTISIDDGAGSITVDGTVTATVGTVTAVTTVGTITNVVHVDDNSGNLSIDDGGNSITVDNGGTFAVQATIAAGATAIAKAEDVASADADVGVPALAVRKATPANTSGTDGDYEFLQMSAGRLWVDASGKTLTVTHVDSGGTDITDTTNHALKVNVVTGSAAGTQYTEDAAAAGDPVGTMVMGVRRDTLSASEVSADGDNVAIKANKYGALRIIATDSAGNEATFATATTVDITKANGTTLDTNSGTKSAGTPRVVIATDQPQLTNAFKVDGSAVTQPISGTVSITDITNAEYETVAASQTAQVLGATGGTGDYISHVLVIPATTSPGNVLLLDNATSITIFTGGATSVSNLVPFAIPLCMKSVSGAWKLTTGANVSCIGVGNFT